VDLERLFAKTIIEEKIIIEVFKELIENLDDNTFNRLFLIWIEAIESDFYYKSIQDEVLKLFIDKMIKKQKPEIKNIQNFIETNIKGQKSKEKSKEVFEYIEEAKTPPIKRYMKQAKSLFETTKKLFKKSKGE
jgi:aspartate/glutamate racemase